jgi:hypothetical protein
LIFLQDYLWFIGLCGGLISGLIVKFVTKAILSKEEKVDYKQKVEMANSEIFNAVRPTIAENIFSNEIIHIYSPQLYMIAGFVLNKFSLKI